MLNYLKILEEFYPGAKVTLSSQNPTDYDSIIWESARISQAELDSFANKSSVDAAVSVSNVLTQGSLFPVINQGIETIPPGFPLCSVGTDPQTGRPIVEKAIGSMEGKMPAIGISISEILSGKTGVACSSGIAENFIDTSSFVAGNALYVGSSGGLTDQKPTDQKWQLVGTVKDSRASGSIIIGIQEINSRLTQRSIDLLLTGNDHAYYRSSSSVNFVTVARFGFRGTETFGVPINVKATCWVSNNNHSGKVRLYDVTNSKLIGTSEYFNNATAKLIDLGPLSNLPKLDAILEFQILSSSKINTVYVSSGHLYFN